VNALGGASKDASPFGYPALVGGTNGTFDHSGRGLYQWKTDRLTRALLMSVLTLKRM